MPRSLRIEFPGAWYHVWQAGREAPMFPLPADNRHFLGLLRQGVDMWRLRVVAYTLLPQGYHLVLQTRQANLSRCMRHINGACALRARRMAGRTVSLFKGRYKATVFEYESYLAQFVRHVHRAPLDMELLPHMDYTWSSYKAYFSRDAGPAWLDTQSLLNSFGGNAREQRLACKTFMNAAESPQFIKLHAKADHPAILGSAAFMDFCHTMQAFARDSLTPSALVSTTPSRIAEAVCNAFGVNQRHLLHSQKGEPNPARNVYIYLLRTTAGMTVRDIAHHVGATGHSTVSSVVGRCESRQRKEPALKRVIQEILAQLHEDADDDSI